MDDLFDAVSRYFPINFTPPKNDKEKITPDLLQGLLKDCMLASPKLCHLFMPFLIERLSAKSIQTKNQCLEIIIGMVETFPYKFLAEELP